MTDYQDIWYESNDGLRLYARDYNLAKSTEVPILCMHGLTRNSADFEDLCASLSQTHRVIAVDQRGRGRSQYDANTQNYNPMVYVQDMWVLLEFLGLAKVKLIGTSMGGMMGMMMAAERPEAIESLILNDIGPEVSADGLARIQSYVGQATAVHNWSDAVEQTKQINAVAFPDYSDQQWQAFSKRLYVENDRGAPELAYDPGIAEPIRQSAGASLSLDLWPVFDLVQADTLVVRGALSDILSADCVAAMKAKRPNLQVAEIPRVGHAPMLDEPAAISAIQTFIAVPH